MTSDRKRQRQIEESLKRFILAESEWEGSARRLTPDFDLLGNGVIDSMGIHQLFSFIQVEFGVEIEDDDLRLENFQSIQRIGRLVVSRLAV